MWVGARMVDKRGQNMKGFKYGDIHGTYQQMGNRKLKEGRAPRELLGPGAVIPQGGEVAGQWPWHICMCKVALHVCSWRCSRQRCVWNRRWALGVGS